MLSFDRTLLPQGRDFDSKFKKKSNPIPPSLPPLGRKTLKFDWPTEHVFLTRVEGYIPAIDGIKKHNVNLLESQILNITRNAGSSLAHWCLVS